MKHDLDETRRFHTFEGFNPQSSKPSFDYVPSTSLTLDPLMRHSKLNAPGYAVYLGELTLQSCT